MPTVFSVTTMVMLMMIVIIRSNSNSDGDGNGPCNVANNGCDSNSCFAATSYSVCIKCKNTTVKQQLRKEYD